uniref:Uncharacterized protein n=1 Tax=Setaria italica TaxID=4555 RepID=K3Y3R7_SETIT
MHMDRSRWFPFYETMTTDAIQFVLQKFRL